MLSMNGSCSSFGSKYSVGGKNKLGNKGKLNIKDNSSAIADDQSEKSSFSRSGNSKIPRMFP